MAGRDTGRIDPAVQDVPDLEAWIGEYGPKLPGERSLHRWSDRRSAAVARVLDVEDDPNFFKRAKHIAGPRLYSAILLQFQSCVNEACGVRVTGVATNLDVDRRTESQRPD
jgi:hypothetical protein